MTKIAFMKKLLGDYISQIPGTFQFRIYLLPIFCVKA